MLEITNLKGKDEKSFPKRTPMFALKIFPLIFIEKYGKGIIK